MSPRGPQSRRKPAGGSKSGPGRSGLTWVYGFHSVREALRARRRSMDRLWVRAGRSRPEHDELVSLAEQAGVAVEHVDRSVLDEAVGLEAQTQGIALRAGPIPELKLAELMRRAEEGSRLGEASRSGETSLSGGVSSRGGARIVALDGVEDPQNVGALARVAESAGADGLILTDRRAPDLTPTVSRASAGAIEWLPVARVPNLSRALAELKDAGYWVLAAALEGGRPLYEIEDRLLQGDLALVLGAEGKGVRPGVLKQADHPVTIPMRGQVGSLNVSTAGAVILYELVRRAESR